MAYSDVGIANMALQRIGAKSSISALNEGTPNAIKANAVWEYIRDEVLEEIKPKFATLRVALSQSSTTPANDEQYDFAYPLPNDYFCLADDKNNTDPVIWPSSVAPYVIETLSSSDETSCLMTNYDSTTDGYNIYLTYVKKVTDVARYTPSFINALTYRLAAEFALSITESGGKYEAMIKLYEKAKKKAKAQSLTQDYLADEKGKSDWVNAGR